MTYPAAFVELMSDLFVGILTAAVSSGLCPKPPVGTLRARCSGVAAMLIERGTTHQSYHFMNWIHRVPRAIDNFGWLLDFAETRAAKFVARHFPTGSIDRIVDVAVRETDNAVLVHFAGSADFAATKPMAADRAEAAVAVLRATTVAQRLLCDLFYDDTGTAWLTHGAAGVGDYLESVLAETPDSPLELEKTRFFAWAWAKTVELRAKVVAPLEAGPAAVVLPTWMFSSVAMDRGPPTTVTIGSAPGADEVVSGTAWTVAAANLPMGTEGITVSSTAALPAPLQIV